MPVTSKREIFPGKNPFHAYHCDALRAAKNTRDINGYSIYRRIIKKHHIFCMSQKVSYCLEEFAKIPYYLE